MWKHVLYKKWTHYGIKIGICGGSMKNSTKESMPHPRVDVILTVAVSSFTPPLMSCASGLWQSLSVNRFEC